MSLIMAALLVIVVCAIALRRRAAKSADGPRRPIVVRATPYAQRDINVDGLRLRYIDEGEGEPILLVPGHTSRIEEYDDVTAILRSRYRVLVFDFPGSGYSEKPDRPYDLAFYDRTIVGFLDAVGVGQCFIAGGSLGGNLALRAARADPARFPRVAAWGPGSAWERKPVMAAFMRHFGYLLFLVTVRIQSMFWFDRGWHGRKAALRAVFAYYREVMCRGFVRMYWGIAADQLDTSLFDIAAEIRQPALLMWGDRDHGFDMGAGVLRLHALMPRSRLVVFAGAGHSLVAERTEAVARELLKFFAETPRSS